MVESTGKLLTKARLAKGLTIDEAAHTTKVRPDKIVALENDDYSRFASNAYARSFLMLYGRFLNVDVSEQFAELEVPSRVSIDDYQYLNSKPDGSAPARSAAPRREVYRIPRQTRAPSVLPLLAFATLLVLVAFVGWIYVRTQQLTFPSPTTLAAEPVQPMVVPEPAPPAPVEETPAPSPAGMPFAPLPPPAVADVSTGIVNELVLEPIRTTWVSIRKDDPAGAPIFEGEVYPGVRPLRLRGQRFYIEVRDESAVVIRKNGNPIAYQPPGISIQ